MKNKITALLSKSSCFGDFFLYINRKHSQILSVNSPAYFMKLTSNSLLQN